MINIVNGILSICVSLIIIYYLLELEKEDCNCVMDWRHNFIKSYNILIIVINLGMMLVDKISIDFKSYIISLLMVLNGINVYCIYTYIGELDAQKCKCAVVDNKNIHNILYYYRYLTLFSILGSFIILVSGVRMLLIIGETMSKNKSIKFSSKGGKMSMKKK